MRNGLFVMPFSMFQKMGKPLIKIQTICEYMAKILESRICKEHYFLSLKFNTYERENNDTMRNGEKRRETVRNGEKL